MPDGQAEMQLVPRRYGLPEAQVTQSVEALPMHVVQSEWHDSHSPLPPWWNPSGHEEMQAP